jgi:hypothetical protein
MGRCCGGFVGDLWEAGTDVVNDVVWAVGDVAEDVFEGVGQFVSAVVDDPKTLLAVGLAIAFPWAGAALGAQLGLTGTVAQVVGQSIINTAINGGDVKAAVISAAIPVVGKEAGNLIGSTLAKADITGTVNTFITNAAVRGLTAEALGKDPLAAITFGGVADGVSAIAGQIDEFKDLHPGAQSAIQDAIATQLVGGDISQSLINSAIKLARTEVATYQKREAALSELAKSGFDLGDDYVSLSPDKKVMVDEFAQAPDVTPDEQPAWSPLITGKDDLLEYYLSLAGDEGAELAPDDYIPEDTDVLVPDLGQIFPPETGPDLTLEELLRDEPSPEIAEDSDLLAPDLGQIYPPEAGPDLTLEELLRDEPPPETEAERAARARVDEARAQADLERAQARALEREARNQERLSSRPQRPDILGEADLAEQPAPVDEREARRKVIRQDRDRIFGPTPTRPERPTEPTPNTPDVLEDAGLIEQPSPESNLPEEFIPEQFFPVPEPERNLPEEFIPEEFFPVPTPEPVAPTPEEFIPEQFFPVPEPESNLPEEFIPEQFFPVPTPEPVAPTPESNLPEEFIPEEFFPVPTPDAEETAPEPLPVEPAPEGNLPEEFIPEEFFPVPEPEQPEQGPTGPLDEETQKRYDEEFAKYLAYLEAGQPPPPDYGVQDLGITQENWDAYNQHMLDMDALGKLPSQWKPGADGTFTYTGDDGDTLTIDSGGNIVGHTDAPKGMLPGETPPPPPPPPTPPRPTTPTPPRPTTPTPPRPTTPTPPRQPAGGTDLGALLALLGGAGGSGQPAAPSVQENSADVQLMEDIFGPTLNLNTPKNKPAKAAQGGSVDELLKLLRG